MHLRFHLVLHQQFFSVDPAANKCKEVFSDWQGREEEARVPGYDATLYLNSSRNRSA